MAVLWFCCLLVGVFLQTLNSEAISVLQQRNDAVIDHTEKIKQIEVAERSDVDNKMLSNDLTAKKSKMTFLEGGPCVAEAVDVINLGEPDIDELYDDGSDIVVNAEKLIPRARNNCGAEQDFCGVLSKGCCEGLSCVYDYCIPLGK